MKILALIYLGILKVVFFFYVQHSFCFSFTLQTFIFLKFLKSTALFLLVISKSCLPLVKKMHIDVRPSTEVFFYGLKNHNHNPCCLDVFIRITVMLKFTHFAQQRKIK